MVITWDVLFKWLLHHRMVNLKCLRLTLFDPWWSPLCIILTLKPHLQCGGDLWLKWTQQKHQSHHVHWVDAFNGSVSIDWNWSCQVLNTLMYSDSFSWITLLPHKRVTQRQDPLVGKCLDIRFYDIFLMGNSCFQTCAVRVVTGASGQVTGNCPSLWPNHHTFCLDSLVVTTLAHFGRATKQYGGGWPPHVFVCWRQKEVNGRGCLVGTSRQPVFFRVALLLVLE